MSIRSIICFALAAGEVLFAGCGAAQPALNPASSAYYNGVGPLGTIASIPAQAAPRLQRPAARGGSGANGLYVALGGKNGVINEYEPTQHNAKPFCQTPLPEPYPLVLDIGVDPHGSLWVPLGPDSYNGQPAEVLEFSKSCALGRPRYVVRTLADPDGQAAGIAFDSKGNAYVDNIIGPGSSDSVSGNISIYAPGATKPTGQLLAPTGGTIWAVYNVAVDSKNTVYFTFGQEGFAYNLAYVDVFPAGSSSGTVLTMKNTWKPLGITFDAKQNMVLADDYLNSVFIFAPPYSGNPTKSIQLHDGSTGSYAYVALNKANTRMYLDNLNDASVEVYSYPAGKYLYSITAGIVGAPTGVALDPPSPN